MSTPIYDKKKQLKYIKGRLNLIAYMVDQLSLRPEEINSDDFKAIELELRNLTKKTSIFHYRNQTKKEKE